MNWIEIENKCPKAINHLYEWLEIEGWESELLNRTFTKWDVFKKDYINPVEGCPLCHCSLFNFFDENEILCSVYFDVDLQMFLWEIAEKNDGKFTGGGGGAKDRGNGEMSAFTTAFEILEDRLNN